MSLFKLKNAIIAVNDVCLRLLVNVLTPIVVPAF